MIHDTEPSSVNPPNQPRLRELFDLLAASRAELEASVSGLSDVEATRSESADAWSVGEIVEHLRIAEAATAKLLSRLLERALEQGLGPETETTSIVARGTARPTPSKVQAPEPMRPASGAALGAALAGLRAARADLLHAAAGGDGLALDSVVYPHFALGPLTFYEWLLFTSRHEQRHTAQIRALRTALGSAR